MQQVNIYVKTSIRGIGKKPGSFIYLLETETKKGLATIYDIGALPEEMSEEAAEIYAIVEALKRMKPGTENQIVIYASNHILKNSFEHHLPAWTQNGFKKRNGEDIANKNLWFLLASSNSVFHLRIDLSPHSYSKWLESELEKFEKRENHNC